MSYSMQSLTELSSKIQVKDTFTLTINSQFLNNNFVLIKQCLLKIQQMDQKLSKEKDGSKAFLDRLALLQKTVASQGADIDSHKHKINQIQQNVGDQFMKKMYQIEAKTKDMYAFDDLVSRLEALNKFVTAHGFTDSMEKVNQRLSQILKIKNQFQRYVEKTQNTKFKDEMKHQLDEKQRKIDHLTEQIKKLEGIVQKTKEISQNASNEVVENSKMLKQINFPQMQDKIKKFKDDVEHRVSELAIKMKKKVGAAQLSTLEQTIIDKLDKFLLLGEKNKADRNQTKDALMYLQKRISDIQQIFASKESEQEKDALFSSRKWQCASCTKDLGKFEGKLGQYRPWSIFPCKELDPEKTGGFGYLNYIDKMAYKKGNTVDDQNLQRLSKTFYPQTSRQNSPKKQMNTTRATNLISNYGSDQKGTTSLKEMYFKMEKTQKGNTERGNSNAKLFRVKRDGNKPENQKERAKEI